MNFIAILITHCVSLNAFAAYDDFRGSSDELRHALSLAGGIASPSVVTALSENPAGLFYNGSSKFQFSLATGTSSFSNLGFDGHFLTGNGYVGAGIGATTYNNFVVGGGSLLMLDFGLGAYVDALNLAIGVAGQYTFYSTGAVWGTYPGNTFGGDIGLIFNPRGRLRVGITGFQVLAGLQAIGMGLAYELSPWADFALDGTLNPSGTTVAIKPDLGIHLWNFQMNIGYGIPVVGSGWTWMRTGVSFAVGFQASYNFLVQAYYNHLALWSFGLTLRL